MDLFDKFSSKENLEQAFDYFNNEAEETSLPLDPLWYPTRHVMERMRETFFDKLSLHIKENGYDPDPADYIYVSKRNLGVRPLAILSTTDRIIYQSILNPDILGKAIDNRLLDCCYGNRVDGSKSYLCYWKKGWHEYCTDQIKSFGSGFIYYAEFDINSFFNSIPISKLMEVLKKDFRINNEKILTLLEKQLVTWDNSKLGIGIPQSSNASNVLANAYLHNLDLYINNISNEDFKYFRYNDDIVVMANSEEVLKDIIYKSSVFLQNYHLNLNEKTKIKKLNNTKIIKDKMFSEDYGNGIFIESRDKIEKIKRNLPGILQRISERKEDKKDISDLTYYLKADSRNEIFYEIINLIPNLSSLAPYVARYLKRFIDDPQTFNMVWNQYENIKSKSWDNFWILKLLLSSTYAFKYKPFQNQLEKIIRDEYEYLIKIPTLYYKKNQDHFKIQNDYIKKLLSNSKTIAEKTNYLFLSLYDEKNGTSSLLEDFLKETSIDIQVIAIAFIKYKNIRGINLDDASSFSKIFFDFSIDTNKKPSSNNFKSATVIVADSQFDVIENIHEEVKNISKILGTERKNLFPSPTNNTLRSINLVTESIIIKDVIFLVLDEKYEMPIRFDVKNNKGGETYIKKLHNIAYIINAEGKKVDYNERLADDINNGLFKKRAVRDYMKTNNFKKPTLVQKSEDGKILVLKNEIPVKTILINAIPTQHRSLYINKTK